MVGPDIDIASELKIRTGFHLVGRQWLSSRIFRLLSRFGISMASLIILLVLCSMLVLTLELLKSMVRATAFKIMNQIITTSVDNTDILAQCEDCGESTRKTLLSMNKLSD